MSFPFLFYLIGWFTYSLLESVTKSVLKTGVVGRTQTSSKKSTSKQYTQSVIMHTGEVRRTWSQLACVNSTFTLNIDIWFSWFKE